ncbi:MAG: helix-hairpin-helix domain-containing protein [Candidatus Hermodarchaeota archaeon]
MGLKLEDINGVGKTTAERMKSAGIDSVEKLSSLKLDDLLKVNWIGQSTAEKYIETAKKLLETLNFKEETNHIEKQQPEGKLVYKKSTNNDLIKLKKVNSPKPMKFPKKEKISSKELKPRSGKTNRKKSTLHYPVKKNHTKKKIEPVLKTFFSEDYMQKIRFLHFKIKNIEKDLDKQDINYNSDDLKQFRNYIRLLNVNYKTQSQIKIFKELELTPNFFDPIEKREIQIWDLMYECTRVLWVLARAYAQLSNDYESKNELNNAIVTIVESSKAYKTAAYFSSACTRQEDIGISLSAENLEFNSEEARVLAQGIVAMREENENSYFRAAKIYSGLSMLDQRLIYLKEFKRKENYQLKAQYNYDMGKACHLNARALLNTLKISKNKKRITRLQEKANYYFYKAEELWEDMLENFDELSEEEKKNLEINLSIVNENIMENDVEIIDHDEALNIQDPDPFVIIPENLAYFLPKTTKYLTKYPTKNLEYRRIKKYKDFKLETKLQLDKIEKLSNKKAGIGRTIKELKTLYRNNEIDINKFSALLEKYSTKYNMIESAINKLKKIYKENKSEKKQNEQVLTH